MTAIHLTVTINSDDLRRWADWHADAGHHGVAHVLYQAANDAAGITAQHDAEVAAKALREAAVDPRVIGRWILLERADRIEREVTSE